MKLFDDRRLSKLSAPTQLHLIRIAQAMTMRIFMNITQENWQREFSWKLTINIFLLILREWRGSKQGAAAKHWELSVVDSRIGKKWESTIQPCKWQAWDSEQNGVLTFQFSMANDKCEKSNKEWEMCKCQTNGANHPPLKHIKGNLESPCVFWRQNLKSRLGPASHT